MSNVYFHTHNCRLKREEAERKREEERIRRQIILEQYRQRKCQEESEKDLPLQSNRNTDSFRQATLATGKQLNSSGSSVLHRVGSRNRPASGGQVKPRPKSFHVSAAQADEYMSLDPSKSSRVTTDDIDSYYHPQSRYHSSQQQQQHHHHQQPHHNHHHHAHSNNNSNSNSNHGTSLSHASGLNVGTSRPQSALSGTAHMLSVLYCCCLFFKLVQI